MDKRVEKREKRRMICTLEAGEARGSGIVLDISQHGLFVQTNLIPPTDELTVRIPDPASGEEIVVVARVRRRRKVDARLASLIGSGLGLRILSAPASFRRLAASEAAQGGDETGSAQQAYQVRLAQRGTPRSRLMVRRAASAKQAEESALQELGPGWVVVETTEV